MKQQLHYACLACLIANMQPAVLHAQDLDPFGVDKTELRKLVYEALDLRDEGAEHTDSYQFEESYTYALSTYSFTGTSQKNVNVAVANLNAALYREQDVASTPEDPYSFIVPNSGFEGYIGSLNVTPLTGWIVDGNFQTGIEPYSSGISCTIQSNDGDQLPNAQISQFIDALLPNGYYVLHAFGTADGSGTYFFANNEATELPGKDINQEIHTAVQVTNNSLTIGARTQGSTASKFRFDEFVLHYLGSSANALTSWIAANLPKREDYIETPALRMTQSLPMANQQCIESYFEQLDALHSATSFTPASFNAAMEKYHSRWADVRLSQQEYYELKTALDTAQKYRSQIVVSDLNVQLIFDQTLSQISSYYTDRTAGDEGKEIATLIEELKAAQTAYIAAATEPGEDPTGLNGIQASDDTPDNSLTIDAAEGGIRIRSTQTQPVRIHTLNGTLIQERTIEAGDEIFITLAPGQYIVGRKVIIVP